MLCLLVVAFVVVLADGVGLFEIKSTRPSAQGHERSNICGKCSEIPESCGHRHAIPRCGDGQTISDFVPSKLKPPTKMMCSDPLLSTVDLCQAEYFITTMAKQDLPVRPGIVVLLCFAGVLTLTMMPTKCRAPRRKT